MAHSAIFERAASALHNEIEIFQSCRHDNICAIRGVAEKGSEAYYCNGTYDSYFWIMDRMVETLEGRMKKWRSQHNTKRRLGVLWRNCSSSYLADPSLDDRMQTAHDMARAIEYLHRQRIVLCDVQPCNFGFAKDNGPVQLFDATMARRLGDDDDELVNEDHKKLLRMHRYMAPELLWGDVYGPKADVYSFLSVFYELWTLKDLESDVKRRCTKNVVKIESRLRMSPDLENLFPRGWSIRPSDRPSMTAVCATLRTALRQLQDGKFREEEDPRKPPVDTESCSSMST
jgi:serine/threonine protein kinase